MASRSSWKDLPLAWPKRQMAQAEASIRLASQLLEEPTASRQRMISARRSATAANPYPAMHLRREHTPTDA